MDDTSIELGIMRFPPRPGDGPARPFWTYITNGMSERRLPGEVKPRGNPEHRFELLAYTLHKTSWVVELLAEMAYYPFQQRSGFAIGHTFEVAATQRGLWSGYLLSFPMFEPAEFNPVAIDIGISDWIFIAQVVGLKTQELNFGIKHGGLELAKRLAAVVDVHEMAFLDVQRVSLVIG
jgi:hypothetical protein